MDDRFNRMNERKSLEDILAGGIDGYMRATDTYVPPAEALPVAVEHRPPGVLTRVNFIIKGVADFGPDAYHGPRQDRVRSDILYAILNPPDEGPKYWLPSVYYEVTDTWDYTGDANEQATTEPRRTAGATPQSEAEHRDIRTFLEALALDQSRLSKQLERLERGLADERAARALEAATRLDGGERGANAGLHGGDGQAVRDGAGHRGGRAQSDGAKADRRKPRGAPADRDHGGPVTADASAAGDPPGAGEVGTTDESLTTVVAAGPGDADLSEGSGEGAS